MYLRDVNASSKSTNKFQKQLWLLTTLPPINASKTKHALLATMKRAYI